MARGGESAIKSKSRSDDPPPCAFRFGLALLSSFAPSPVSSAQLGSASHRGPLLLPVPFTRGVRRPGIGILPPLASTSSSPLTLRPRTHPIYIVIVNKRKQQHLLLRSFLVGDTAPLSGGEGRGDAKDRSGGDKISAIPESKVFFSLRLRLFLCLPFPRRFRALLSGFSGTLPA